MSETKLHYNPVTGKTGPCGAKKGQCPYVDPEDPNQGHYESQEELDAYIEKRAERVQAKELEGYKYRLPDELTVNISEIAPKELWESELAKGNINAQTNLDETLRIYKYSKETQYTKNWNEATLVSRGIILDNDGRVIARPYRKFFNYGELSEEERAELKGPIVVSDKLDGSLGISYIDPADGEFKLASSGSFLSEMAQHATEIYKERYKGTWGPEEGYTYLYEVIYPENRIVVNYEGEDDIILTGKVNIKTGRSVPLTEITEWPGRKAEVFSFNSIEEVAKSPYRPNTEGFVIHYPETDKRVKVKYEEYVKLHRTATGLTSIRIWESLSGNFPNALSTEEMRAGLEEEFLPYFDQKVKEYTEQVESKKRRAEESYVKMRKAIGTANMSDKAVAIEMNKKEYGLSAAEKGYIMKFHKREDTKRAEWGFWKEIRPAHEKAM